MESAIDSHLADWSQNYLLLFFLVQTFWLFCHIFVYIAFDKLSVRLSDIFNLHLWQLISIKNFSISIFFFIEDSMYHIINSVLFHTFHFALAVFHWMDRRDAIRLQTHRPKRRWKNFTPIKNIRPIWSNKLLNGFFFFIISNWIQYYRPHISPWIFLSIQLLFRLYLKLNQKTIIGGGSKIVQRWILQKYIRELFTVAKVRPISPY